MRFTVVLPAGLADTSTDIFTITTWQKEIGDLVRQGETIATIKPLDSADSHKEINIPSPAFGILAKKSVLEGDGIESGEPLGVLSGVPEPITPSGSAEAQIPFAAAPYVPGGPEDAVSRSTADQLLALHDARSLRTSPHVTTAVIVNMGEVMRLKERVAASLAEREGIALDILPFVLSAVGAALLEYPLLNAQLHEKKDEIRLRRYVNLAFTVRSDEGHLTVPVIRGPEKMSILGLARTAADLTTRARTNTLVSDEVRGATFTVTQVPPSADILWQTPIIHQPQAAILSVGSVNRAPVVLEDDTVVVRPLLHLCLAHDARIVDSETAGRFLGTVKRCLEEAQFLFA
jgi:pyruvate/2-oxoglutarate dehydrogenase complex dihydrolipoamide acyltransferase (E2) component